MELLHTLAWKVISLAISNYKVLFMHFNIDRYMTMQNVLYCFYMRVRISCVGVLCKYARYVNNDQLLDRPIPVAERSLAGIAGWNSTGGMYFCLFNIVCCHVEVSATGRSLAQRSSTDCGESLYVIYKPRKWGWGGGSCARKKKVVTSRD